LKIPEEIKVYGDFEYRDKKCPKESIEQITFVNRVRNECPETFGRVLVHAENEGKLINGQFSAISKSRAMGQAKGASDIIIPGNPAFVCEMKRKDSTLSKVSDEQIEYLLAANKCGAFACVAYGHEAAWQAFEDWRILCIQYGGLCYELHT
jgi:hypothetical protein